MNSSDELDKARLQCMLLVGFYFGEMEVTTLYVYKNVESWMAGDIPTELHGVVDIYHLDSGSYAVAFEKTKIMLPASVVIMTEEDFNEQTTTD